MYGLTRKEWKRYGNEWSGRLLGHTCLLYTSKQAVYQCLEELRQEGVYGIGRLFTAEEARDEEHLYGGFSFVIESDGYTSFGDKAVRPLVQNFDVNDYRFGRATHG